MRLAILDELCDLAATAHVACWTSPLESEGFKEFQDEDFLRAVGLGRFSQPLRGFWPRRGPVWDALAIVGGLPGEQRLGVLLVEGKSYPGEVYGPGCQARSTASRKMINSSLDKTKQWLDVDSGRDWLGPLYQSANRLAHLYWLREELRVPAWLVNLYFVDDPRSPTNVSEWRAHVTQVTRELGLPTQRQPYLGHVVLPARSRDELLG